jgi:hypothetical protein
MRQAGLEANSTTLDPSIPNDNILKYGSANVANAV